MLRAVWICIQLSFVVSIFPPLLFRSISVFPLKMKELCRINEETVGTCEFLPNCKSAMEGLQKKVKPVLCGFTGDIPIICCANTNIAPIKVNLEGSTSISEQKWNLEGSMKTSEQKIGEMCTINEKNGGTCTLLSNCKSGVKDLRKKVKPVVCGFSGDIPIICCANTNTVPIEVNLEASTSTSESSNINLGGSTNEQNVNLEGSMSTSEPNVNLEGSTSTSERNVILEESTSISGEKMNLEGSTSTSGQEVNLEGSTNTSDQNVNRAGSARISEQKCKQYLDLNTPYQTSDSIGNGLVDAKPEDFPHMALLGYRNKRKLIYNCGGSLISEQFVLTRAYCLNSTNLGPVVAVRLGDSDTATNTDEAEPQDFGISATFAHPDSDVISSYNDIGLIKLDRPVNITKYVKPACLQSEFEWKADDNLTASVWLAKYERRKYKSSKLQKLPFMILPNDNCLQTYINQSTIERIDDKRQICAGTLDSCPLGTGGPLQTQIQSNPPVYRIVGVSHSEILCFKLSAVYTRVSAYIPWIESIVWSG